MDIQEYDKIYEIRTKDKTNTIYHTYQFEIPSKWGRGGVESLMLATLLEEELELETIEVYFKKFVNLLKDTPDIFKGLHLGTKKVPQADKDFANRASQLIYKEFIDLHQVLDKRAQERNHIEFLFREINLSSKVSLPKMFHTIIRTLITIIDARLPEGSAQLFEAGSILAEKFRKYLEAPNLEELFRKLQGFWQECHFGRIEPDLNSTALISFRIYECFECSHIPNAETAICKFNQGFWAKLYSLHLNQSVSVDEIHCNAANGEYCEFQIQYS